MWVLGQVALLLASSKIFTGNISAMFNFLDLIIFGTSATIFYPSFIFFFFSYGLGKWNEIDIFHIITMSISCVTVTRTIAIMFDSFRFVFNSWIFHFKCFPLQNTVSYKCHKVGTCYLTLWPIRAFKSACGLYHHGFSSKYFG